MGDKVGEGRKQMEPVLSWLGEIKVGVLRVAELDRDVRVPFVRLVGVVWWCRKGDIWWQPIPPPALLCEGFSWF